MKQMLWQLLIEDWRILHSSTQHNVWELPYTRQLTETVVYTHALVCDHIYFYQQPLSFQGMMCSLIYCAVLMCS